MRKKRFSRDVWQILEGESLIGLIVALANGRWRIEVDGNLLGPSHATTSDAMAFMRARNEQGRA